MGRRRTFAEVRAEERVLLATTAKLEAELRNRTQDALARAVDAINAARPDVLPQLSRAIEEAIL